MKFNFKKGNTLFRYAFYKIVFDNESELLLPLKTQKATILEEIQESITKGVKIPTKLEPLKKEEIKELETIGFVIPKGTMQKRVIDETSKQYIELRKRQAKYNKFMVVAMYIDLKFKFEDGKELWEHLELKNDTDYLGLCEFLEEIGVDESMLERIYQHIALMKISGASNYKEAEEKFTQVDLFFNEDIINAMKELGEQKNEK